VEAVVAGRSCHAAEALLLDACADAADVDGGGGGGDAVRLACGVGLVGHSVAVAETLPVAYAVVVVAAAAAYAVETWAIAEDGLECQVMRSLAVAADFVESEVFAAFVGAAAGGGIASAAAAAAAE
jgi:hypothetical protein